jgi:hypothetical protein
MKRKINAIVVCLVLVVCVCAQEDKSAKPNMTANLPEGEAVFSEADLKDYYLVYQNKAVQHIRSVIERYLKNPKKLDDETEHLKDIDSSYLKSKFTVLSRDPDVFGNTHVMLIFVDKPDKVFAASVYTGNGYRLDRFAADERFNNEDLRRVRVRYRKFLEDKVHVM